MDSLTGLLIAIIMALIVVVDVLLYKLIKQKMEAREDQLSHRFDEVYREISETSNSIHRSIEETSNNLSGRIDDVESEVNGRFDEVYRDTESKVMDLNNEIEALNVVVAIYGKDKIQS